MVVGVWRAILMAPAFGNLHRERVSLFLLAHFSMQCEFLLPYFGNDLVAE
jgi:hypothetical protein